MSEQLPIHGFVLAGGKSSRMGVDKALLEFGGKTLVEIAVEKLCAICAEVSIVGNRDDLSAFAPVVHEDRLDCGPAAGVEAGLKAAKHPWAMFMPVDVPLIPVDLLELWVREAISAKMPVSYLGILGKQPVFCLLQRERLASFSKFVDSGERRLEVLLNQVARADEVASCMYDERELYAGAGRKVPGETVLERWLMNLNTPADVAAASEA